MTRRKFIQSATLAAAASPLLPKLAHAEDAAPAKLKGNIHHSACRWCYGKIKLDDLCAVGKTPRNFAFDPTGKWILCSNHGSDNAVVFRVDESTGKLTQTGPPVSVPYPFCERFLPVR